MGCICSKRAKSREHIESNGVHEPRNQSKGITVPPRREEIVFEREISINGKDISEKLSTKSEGIVDQSRVTNLGHSEVVSLPKRNFHQRSATVDIGSSEKDQNFGICNVSSFEVDHVADGWPSWLASVAGDAIKGLVPRRADSFEKLGKIGQGTYSSVYKARDLETGKIVALKKVRFFSTDPESVRFMAREIHILRKLDHPNIVKLEGLVTSRISCSLYLVFEYMEHDLAGLATIPGQKFTEPQVKCLMRQLLLGLEHCHSCGILHRDIKGSNLLIDDNGILKIADFGLATTFLPDQTQPMTSRVVTLWYRPPELLLGATEYGTAVDMWSTGCILAELLAGKPIMPGMTEVEQLHKIFKLCGSPSEDYWRKSKLPHATIFKPQHPYKSRLAEAFKDFPSSALSLLEVLLAVEPEYRTTAASALDHDFFRMSPLACEPSALPKFPPTKAFDAIHRELERRKQRDSIVRKRGSESVRRDSKQLLETNVNAQKRNPPQSTKCTSQRYNYQEERGDRSHLSRGSLKNDFINSSVSLSQRSRIPWGLSDSSNFMREEKTGNSNNYTTRSTHSRSQEQPSDAKYGRMDNKEFTKEYGPRKNRIHYSGPLMPPGGNLEELLKEHERQIQLAVRKARIEKAKSKINYASKA